MKGIDVNTNEYNTMKWYTVLGGGEGIPIRQGPGTVTPHQGYQCLGLLPYRRYTPTHSLVLIVLTSLGL